MGPWWSTKASKEATMSQPRSTKVNDIQRRSTKVNEGYTARVEVTLYSFLLLLLFFFVDGDDDDDEMPEPDEPPTPEEHPELPLPHSHSHLPLPHSNSLPLPPNPMCHNLLPNPPLPAASLLLSQSSLRVLSQPSPRSQQPPPLPLKHSSPPSHLVTNPSPRALPLS